MAERLKRIGTQIIRYGLVLVLLWIGGMKFTAYEAEGIKPLVANSPLMGWVYDLMSVTAFSSLLAVVMFLTTLSFLVTTPGWEPSLGGFPALSAMPGQFVLKDIVLLGAALWT